MYYGRIMIWTTENNDSIELSEWKESEKKLYEKTL